MKADEINKSRKNKFPSVIIIFIVIIAVVFVGIVAIAIYRVTFGCGDHAYWKINGNTLVIHGKGEIETLPGKEKGYSKIIIEEGITGIGHYVELPYSPENVEFPKSLKYLDTHSLIIDESNNTGTFIVPEGIEELGVGFAAGYDNSNNSSAVHNIREVHLPSTVKYIDSGAFDEFSDVETFTIEDNSNYTVSDGVLFNKDMSILVSYPCGRKGDEFASYTVPDSVVSIAPGAFSSNESWNSLALKNLTLGANTDLSSYSQYPDLYPDSKSDDCHIGITRLFEYDKIEIFAAKTNVSIAMLDMYVENVYVSPANNLYQSIDGVLFSKDGTVLYWFPPGKLLTTENYSVPEGVTAIASLAFNDNSYLDHSNVTLKQTQLPSTLQIIGYRAFEGLNEITLPVSLKIISGDIGMNEGINYSGSVEEWKNNVTVYNADKEQDHLECGEVNCSDGIINTGVNFDSDVY